MDVNTFTYVLAGFVALVLMSRLWLALRQLRHVARHRDCVPEAFAAHIELAAHQKAADYTRDKTRLSMKESVADMGLLLLFTLGGGIALVDHLSASVFGGAIWRDVATVLAVMAISGLVMMPFDIIRTFVIEARYGFNKLTWKLFILDGIKGMLLGLAIGVPLLLITFWLMARMGDFWWLYVWLVWLGFSLTMMVAYPKWIAPLFNKFTPLADEALKARIEALMRRCGFQSQGLFVMDGSKRSSHGNAYFTGFGRTKRIVFFDTLIERLSPEEIEAVLAHELGHFKLGHIPKMMVAHFGIALLVLAAMGWVIDKAWFYQGLGFAGVQSTGVALLLFFMLLPVFTFPLSPLASVLSRKHEFEADAFAAGETRSQHLVSALVKLYRDNASTLTPDPVHSMMYDSHPPASLRVAHLEQLHPHTDSDASLRPA
ncbi:MAG: M48 family metallopeptidase [Betaproteobacteria bacterium]|nr:M48 family metallopeptidase [Betaproteobacteria bacterium]